MGMKKYIIIALLLIAGTASAVMATKGQPKYLYQWYSTDPSRVGVNPDTGLINPVWYGSADICAQLKSDLSIKFCTTVTVN